MTPYYENVFSSLTRDFKLFLLLRLTISVWHFSSLDAKEVKVAMTNLPITYNSTPIPVTPRFLGLSNLATFVVITEVLMNKPMFGDLTPCILAPKYQQTESLVLEDFNLKMK